MFALIFFGIPIAFHIGMPKISTMTPQQVLDHFGTQAEIARALGCKQPSVAEWFADGKVPEGRQYQIELATNGALRAEKPANRTSADDNAQCAG